MSPTHLALLTPPSFPFPGYAPVKGASRTSGDSVLSVFWYVIKGRFYRSVVKATRRYYVILLLGLLVAQM